ncbi:helix-turn-helix domain-containing protein [Flavobacterium taihuense]|uniref:Helix-turn-helix transcriptional regulator n=1 Tax=Flavobacterium taihuense TaxID=2857508 RepID=A0ABS6XVC4_9FLAO|nr:helix-turn-helix domain-containing protein [Flavobacterium taihuense]MBW4360628.1 helix-turn-helix transcriptional regulator [Flavobacterium taihuense]
MFDDSSFTLVNPQNGNLAFKLSTFDSNCQFSEIQRLNYFSLIWIQKGSGLVTADFSENQFEAGDLFAFSPYQPFMLASEENIEGVAIHFHPEFFCIYKHQAEIATNGILFNNIFKPPFVTVDEVSKKILEMVVGQIRTEMQKPELAQYELLVSYLKIFLITATRLKNKQQPDEEFQVSTDAKEPYILQNLKNYIELHFKTKHSASDYAELLNITPKALAKITKNHFNKTLTDLISERIIIEAKRELYLTNKAVKEIAFELGYDDEHYFSRFFKNNAEVSPQIYRDTVGFARGMA